MSFPDAYYCSTCNLLVFYPQIQVIHGKKILRVQVWHLKSKIPVGPGAGNLQVHLCLAWILNWFDLLCRSL